MSDKPQSNEPLIIKSDRPHEVTMPEGTNIAVGKKGEEGTPAIRKVLADPDAHVVELSPDASIVPAEASNVDALFPWCTYQVTINAPVPDPSSEIETTSAPLLFLKKRKRKLSR